MRHLGSTFKRSRRLGFSLLENNKEFTKNKARTTKPGVHGANRTKLSNYGQQLQEKQKLMFLYGLNDRQFRRLFKVAQHKHGILTLNLLQTLESRLDSLVFRAGLAPTRKAARQLVSHNHVLVNGQKLNIPSALLKVGDKIEIKNNAKTENLRKMTVKSAAQFLTVDEDAKSAIFTRLPERDELPADVNEAYVVEWYSRLM